MCWLANEIHNSYITSFSQISNMLCVAVRIQYIWEFTRSVHYSDCIHTVTQLAYTHTYVCSITVPTGLHATVQGCGTCADRHQKLLGNDILYDKYSPLVTKIQL